MISKTYPNTEVYLVTWAGGSGGAFITALLNKLIYNYPTKTFLKLSHFGNAHNHLAKLNWLQRYNNEPYEQNTSSVYSKIVPLNPEKPLILFQHWTPSWDELFYIYPKAKHILITFSVEDLHIIKLNVFLKHTLESNLPKWNNLKEQEKDRIIELADIDNPKDITKEVLDKLFPVHNVGKIYYPFYDDSDIPVNSNQIYKINYFDLLTNKYKVLDNLNKITNKLITDDIVLMYEEYITKQKEITKKYMPDSVYDRYFGT